MARREKGTGNVREDPQRPGSWIGTIQVDGRRYTARGRTKTDVSSKLAQFKAEALTGTGRSRDDRTITVAQVIDQFLQREIPNRQTKGRPLAPGTIDGYRHYLAAVEREIGKTRLSKLTVGKVEQMLDALADRGYSYTSLVDVRTKFSTVVSWAEKRDVVHRNVVRLATIPPTAKRTRKRNALQPADARKLLEQLRLERNGAMYGLSLLLGLRPGEAAALFWVDIDLDEGTVNVTRGLQRNGGKVAVVDELKTERSKRTIEMPSDLIEWLREHRAAQRRERLAAHRWTDDRLVFATPDGTVIDPSNSRDDLEDICVRAAVPRTRPNELRHSCASLLSDRGVPLERIADLLGHVDTRMLERTYRHRLRPVVDVAAKVDWLSASS